MDNSRDIFLNTKPSKLFFRAALPGSISMVAASIYQMIDGIMVGQALGELSFAALNLAMPFVIINFALADLIGVGSSVPISIALGRKEDDEANNYFTSAIIMIITTGLLMGILLFSAAPLLISLMGAEGELVKQGATYIRSYAIFSPLITLPFALDNYLRIIGKVRLSMFMNILSCVISVVLEFLFLFVFKTGILGAGLACSLSFLIVSVAGLIYFGFGKKQLRFVKPRFSIKLIKTVVSAGMPIFLSNMAGRITSIAMNSVLLFFGGSTAVSVYGVLMYTDGLAQPLIYGICDSLQPAIGCNYGAGRHDRVKAIEKYCFSASAVVSIAAAIIVFLFPSQIASLFMDGDGSEYLTLATVALRIFSISFAIRWFSFATQSLTIAIDKPREASILSVSTAMVFPMVLIAVLYPLGLTGVWINIPLTYVLASILAAFILKRILKELK